MSADLIHQLSAAALAFAIITYVVLDGTDLGVGILFPFHKETQSRHVMAFSILPIWDGNETWLVLGGGGLLALFPAAYSIFFTAMYVPIIAMLLALVFRGVSLEFRDRATPAHRRWHDMAFAGASTLAGLCQGIVLGGLIQGIPNDGSRYTGNGWDWLSGFTLTCGIGLVVGYALLGACWLVWRTEGDLQARALKQASLLGGFTLLLMGLVIVWTAGLHPLYRERWAQGEWVIPLLGLMALLALAFWKALPCRIHYLPLFAVLGWFMVAYAALILALYPLVIPPALTIFQASSPTASQAFMLTGFAVLIPFTLAYSTYGFWVFRGKIRPREKADGE